MLLVRAVVQGIAASACQPGARETVSELAVESAPDVAVAQDAARGQVVYITGRGNRLAGIVPVELAAIVDRLTTDEPDELAAAAELAGLTNAAGLIEDAHLPGGVRRRHDGGDQAAAWRHERRGQEEG